MKATLATLISVLALTLTLAMTVLAAPPGGCKRDVDTTSHGYQQRSATGQANGCGPKL